MKNFTKLCGACLCMAMFGCSSTYTGKHMEAIKQQASDGDYGWAAYSTVMTPIVAIADIATLGGNVAPEDTANAAIQIHQQQQLQEQQELQRQQALDEQRRLQEEQQRQQIEAAQRQAEYLSQQQSSSYQNDQQHTSSMQQSNMTASASGSMGRQKINLPGHGGCISAKMIPEKSDNTIIYYYVKNDCAYTVNAHWCDRVGCTHSSGSWELSSGEKNETWVLRKDFGGSIKRWACQLKNGPHDVWFDSETGQCWSYMING